MNHLNAAIIYVQANIEDSGVSKSTHILLWDKSFKSRTELRNFHSMVFNFKIHTPPFLEHNNSRSIIFANNICIKCLAIDKICTMKLENKFHKSRNVEKYDEIGARKIQVQHPDKEQYLINTILVYKTTFRAAGCSSAEVNKNFGAWHKTISSSSKSLGVTKLLKSNSQHNSMYILHKFSLN